MPGYAGTHTVIGARNTGGCEGNRLTDWREEPYNMQVKEENICQRVISPRKNNRAEGKDKKQGGGCTILN